MKTGKKSLYRALIMTLVLAVAVFMLASCDDLLDSIPDLNVQDILDEYNNAANNTEGNNGEPTEKPTEAPTEKPTEAPTEKPTEAPTEKPTEAPTEKPTEAPTEKPTENPTEEPAEPPSEPETITVQQALEIGKSLSHNVTTTEKYYISGVIVDIVDTYYGNMTIMDENGNTIYIYGTHSADGSQWFGYLENPPLVGDSVKLLTVVGNYNGPQLKDAWILEYSTPTQGDIPNGSVTVEDGKVIVSTAGELLDLVNKLNNGNISKDITVELGADIDMQGVRYTPIYEFRGVFDGKGYKISNISLALDGALVSLTDGNWVGYTVNTIGFIGSAYDATIKNLTLENVTATYHSSKEIFLGALVGYADGIQIENCSVSSDFEVSLTHQTYLDISGVSGLVGYSLDAHASEVTVCCKIDYTADSYEAFVGSMLGVGNIRIYDCNIQLDISFVGTQFGHTGSIIGMERTPSDVTLACMYGSTVTGKLYIDNPSGYDWGEVGQGYFYDPESGNTLDVLEHNEIEVEKTVK